ncbi:hypothetical protein LAZ67_10002366 [Cordylochernes scorpioides]|uniref:Reverse transcriptase domain-containing protein n=1 Tax=Cordylochernes scorpioides TaxID=51811 RepID=A0ABY6KWL2_9ARAC|nr:hypothetical protein LAZ67_10002366 [Cordylochernes scorpioides]
MASSLSVFTSGVINFTKIHTKKGGSQPALLPNRSRNYVRSIGSHPADSGVSDKARFGNHLEKMVLGYWLHQFRAMIIMNDPILDSEITNADIYKEIAEFGDIHLLLYADDIAIIGESRMNLQKKIKILKEYLDENLMTLNESKSKIMVFRDGAPPLYSTLFCYKPSYNRPDQTQNSTTLPGPDNEPSIVLGLSDLHVVQAMIIMTGDQTFAGTFEKRLHEFHEFMLLELIYDEQRPLPKSSSWVHSTHKRTLQNQNRALLLRLSLSLCAVQDRSDPEDHQTGCTAIKRGDVLCMVDQKIKLHLWKIIMKLKTLDLLQLKMRLPPPVPTPLTTLTICPPFEGPRGDNTDLTRYVLGLAKVEMTPRQVEDYFAACDMQRLGKDITVWANINPANGEWMGDKTREDLDVHCQTRIANIQDAISHMEECLTDELKNGLPEFSQIMLTLLQDLCSNSTVLDQAVTSEKSAIIDQDIYMNCLKEVKMEDDNSMVENIGMWKPLYCCTWAQTWQCFDKMLMNLDIESRKKYIHHMDFYLDALRVQFCGTDPLDQQCALQIQDNPSLGAIIFLKLLFAHQFKFH